MSARSRTWVIVVFGAITITVALSVADMMMDPFGLADGGAALWGMGAGLVLLWGGFVARVMRETKKDTPSNQDRSDDDGQLSDEDNVDSLVDTARSNDDEGG